MLVELDLTKTVESLLILSPLLESQSPSRGLPQPCLSDPGISRSMCPTLCDPMDCGIHQARILEWVAISFSRGSS